jgi:hypothetical protein
MNIVGQYRLKELATKKSRTRKWYKWICKQGLYEVSVRVKGDVEMWEWNQIVSPRLVFEVTPYQYKKSKTINEGPLSGMTYPTMIYVDGYARLRTDNEYYYPLCGKAGIPHETLSGASKRFEEWMQEGWRKKDKIIAEKKYEKWKAAWELKEMIRQANAGFPSIRKQVLKHDRESAAKARQEDRANKKAEKTKRWEQWKEERAKRASYNARMKKCKPNAKFFQMLAGAQAISEYATNQKK